MLRSAVTIVMWVGRATVFLVGLVVIAVLMFGVASSTLAGNGDPLKLGQKNTASKLTALIGTVAGDAALLVRNAGGGTALDLRVDAGQPPMVVNSGVLVTNLNADRVGGKQANEFVANSFYRKESAIAAGTALGDGTFVAFAGCDAGDRLVSGGPANVAPTSVLVENFPDSSGQWKARIHKNGQSDNWNVVALCANQ